ncbi:MAG: M48 family metallopeptidase [Bdellovibrio sp.]
MRILSASTQVWLFLIIVSLLCLVTGYQLGDRFGLFLGLLTTLCLHVFLFVFGDSRLMRTIQASPVKGQDPWDLNEKLADLSFRIGLHSPELSLVDSPSALAFSVGQPWRRGRVVLSTGLLQKLSGPEIEAVLAHQLGHLNHMDSFRFGAIAGCARLVLGFAHFLDYLWVPNFWLKQKQEPFLGALSPLAWLILRFSVNDKSCFKNDDLAVRLVRNKKVLAEALWKLDGLSRTQPYQLPPCTSHYFVVNPQSKMSRSRWLESHPGIEVRIRRLIGTDSV